jgi:hypothetical protein
MTHARPTPAARRALHAAGFLVLLGFVAVAASALEGRPFWRATAAEGASVVLWALTLHGLLLVGARLSQGPSPSPLADYLRALGLLLFSAATLVFYFTPNRIGPIDAQWYGNMTADFLAQARSGTFPVLAGATPYAFNGAVHPFRSAPWQFIFADFFDIATGRSMAALALEHLTAIASYSGAVLFLYVGLSRSRPRAKWAACLFALIYATSPCVTGSLFQHDMYMTLMAAPAMVAVFLGLQRALDEGCPAAYAWLGAGCAALWYCHPPTALLTCLAAGFCIVCHGALSGTPARTAALSALALAVFGALAAPYFLSMSEIVNPGSDPLADVAMPALALLLLAISCGGLLRSGSILWLAPLAAAFLCLRQFKAPLLPFALCFSVLVCAVASLGSRFPRLRAREQAYPWFFGLGLAAALLAATVFSRESLPADGVVSSYVGISASKWRNFFMPIWGRILDQPGYLSWFLLAGALAFMGSARSSFARIGAAAGLGFVCALGILGPLSLLLWLNCPGEFTSVFEVAYDLRILPVMAPLIAAATFIWFVDFREDHPRLGRAVLGVVVALIPWALVEHGRDVVCAGAYRRDAAYTADHYRTENTVLQRYSWDLMLVPRFFSNGVMDPALESRFWRTGDRTHALIDPDRIEKALEAPGQRPVPFTATPIPTGPTWLTLSPKIELDPGEHVLVRFDFLGRVPEGWLIVQGQSIYREYILPSSGQEFSFGSLPDRSHTLSLWNSGPKHESLELFIIRPDARALDPGPYCLAYITPYIPKRAPIEILSFMPLRLRVDAPEAGYLETVRSSVPGYKVYVDGKRARAYRSGNGLVSVPLAKGSREVLVWFGGTVALHTAVRWACAAWLVALLALVLHIARECALAGPGKVLN